MGGRTISLPATPTKEEGYVDAEGKPVQKWEQTARYAEAMRVNESMKRAADQMERNRYSRDMAADITNQNVKDSARESLARMDREQAAARQGQLLEQQGISAGLDQQIKRNSLAQTAQEQQLIARLNDPKLTPEEKLDVRNNLLVMNNKNPNADRFLRIEGGEEIGPDGMTKIRRPSGVFDTVTQTFKPMELSSQMKTAGPSIGEVRGGYKFKGGDPANKANWEKA